LASHAFHPCLPTPQPSALCGSTDQTQNANPGLNKLRLLLLQPKIIPECPFFLSFTQKIGEYRREEQAFTSVPAKMTSTTGSSFKVTAD